MARENAKISSRKSYQTTDNVSFKTKEERIANGENLIYLNQLITFTGREFTLNRQFAGVNYLVSNNLEKATEEYDKSVQSDCGWSKDTKNFILMMYKFWSYCEAIGNQIKKGEVDNKFPLNADMVEKISDDYRKYIKKFFQNNPHLSFVINVEGIKPKAPSTNVEEDDDFFAEEDVFAEE